jgi:uncharacterized membrane protein YoaK (UPF0700 family)
MSVSPAAVGAEQESLSERAAASIKQPLTRTLLVLTFTTGLVDATSYLGLGHVFTANMTGNVVLLGFGIVGGGSLPVVAPLISLVAFLVGAGVGGALARKLADRHTRYLASALAIEVSLLAVAAIAVAAIDIRRGAVSSYAVITLLAMAMGLRSATVRRIAVADLSTTVLTMTLTGLAANSPLFGGTGKGSTRRSSAALGMFAGALAGALLLKTSLILPVAAASALALVAGLVYIPMARRDG